MLWRHYGVTFCSIFFDNVNLSHTDERNLHFWIVCLSLIPFHTNSSILDGFGRNWYTGLILGANLNMMQYFGLEDDVTLKLAIFFVIFSQ